MNAHSVSNRCTESDYRMLFASSTEELRWLCYTLIGDEELGDRALNAALEQSLKGADRVFREWMLGWARRLIIKFCITTVRPWTSELVQRAFPISMRLDSLDSSHLTRVLDLPLADLRRLLLRQDALSRFVFALRALEGYSRRDTSLLLNIDDRACEWVYLRATDALHSNVEQIDRPWNNERNEQAEYCFARAGD